MKQLDQYINLAIKHANLAVAQEMRIQIHAPHVLKAICNMNLINSNVLLITQIA